MDDAWPEHVLASNHPVREWRARSEGTWDAIRRDYLAGAAARDLCDRYDVALSTLRLKAREGGWRRADHADSDLFPAGADAWTDPAASHADGVAEEESWAELAERARFRLRRAIGSGRAAEAASWLRIHGRLAALAAAEAAPVSPPEPAPDPVDAIMAVADQVGAIARRAARTSDDADIEALQAQVEALEARAAALTADPGSPGAAETLDSLDSLDPVFSGPPPRPDRAALLRTRERRLELGLGVSDLDRALAALDSAPGLSP